MENLNKKITVRRIRVLKVKKPLLVKNPWLKAACLLGVVVLVAMLFQIVLNDSTGSMLSPNSRPDEVNVMDDIWTNEPTHPVKPSNLDGIPDNPSGTEDPVISMKTGEQPMSSVQETKISGYNCGILHQ